MDPQRLNALRTLLVLGRVSNLPTVWSNCLAGWLLGGSGRWGDFLLVCLGATFLYSGGMFLNDAFDADFDRQHRPERPIPSGAISAAAVWRWGLSLLGAGLVFLALLGAMTLILGVLLALTILVYDAVHKIVAFSPVLMAMCRFLLVLVAAGPTGQGPTGLVIWSALVLGCYVAGLSYLARRESWGRTLQYWPCVFLAAPVVLAMIVNRGPYIIVSRSPYALQGTLLTLLFSLWVVRCLSHAYWSPQRNLPRSVSGLLAGIVLVDWLAVGGVGPVAVVFAALFALALLYQRFIPAT